MSRPYHTEHIGSYIDKRNTLRGQINALQTRKDQEPTRKEARRHHRDQSPRQRSDENKGMLRCAQRQRREPYADAESDPIMKLDTIIRAHMLKGSQ